MPSATYGKGRLKTIDNCYLIIPGVMRITVDNLPDLGESKNAQYNADSVIGRSSPMHTYHYSDTRNINLTFHFYVFEKSDIDLNLKKLRAIRSCLYPRQGKPFDPPTICRLRCGDLLASGQDTCVILTSCSVRYPTDVAWDPDTLCPYRMDVDTTWWEVYSSPDLPDNKRIFSSGR